MTVAVWVAVGVTDGVGEAVRVAVGEGEGIMVASAVAGVSVVVDLRGDAAGAVGEAGEGVTGELHPVVQTASNNRSGNTRA